MDPSSHRYFILNKPCNMVSQFVSSHEVRLLGSVAFDFPPQTHAIGRLDSHSEGLLILTTNKRVTRLLFQGSVPHTRTYLVQVKNAVSPQNLSRLQNGVSIRVKTGIYYTTPPCEVRLIGDPESIYPFASDPKEHHPHTWLLISLKEGKYHQLRKMVAAIHHPCKRLIRTAIEDLELNDLPPGAVREIASGDFFRKLKIDVQASGPDPLIF
jgi:23S rRNA pseudouridine2457 synthase